VNIDANKRKSFFQHESFLLESIEKLVDEIYATQVVTGSGPEQGGYEEEEEEEVQRNERREGEQEENVDREVIEVEQQEEVDFENSDSQQEEDSVEFSKECEDEVQYFKSEKKEEAKRTPQSIRPIAILPDGKVEGGLRENRDEEIEVGKVSRKRRREEESEDVESLVAEKKIPRLETPRPHRPLSFGKTTIDLMESSPERPKSQQPKLDAFFNRMRKSRSDSEDSQGARASQPSSVVSLSFSRSLPAELAADCASPPLFSQPLSPPRRVSVQGAGEEQPIPPNPLLHLLEDSSSIASFLPSSQGKLRMKFDLDAISHLLLGEQSADASSPSLRVMTLNGSQELLLVVGERLYAVNEQRLDERLRFDDFGKNYRGSTFRELTPPEFLDEATFIQYSHKERFRRLGLDERKSRECWNLLVEFDKKRKLAYFERHGMRVANIRGNLFLTAVYARLPALSPKDLLETLFLLGFSFSVNDDMKTIYCSKVKAFLWSEMQREASETNSSTFSVTDEQRHAFLVKVKDLAALRCPHDQPIALLLDGHE